GVKFGSWKRTLTIGTRVYLTSTVLNFITLYHFLLIQARRFFHGVSTTSASPTRLPPAKPRPLLGCRPPPSTKALFKALGPTPSESRLMIRGCAAPCTWPSTGRP